MALDAAAAARAAGGSLDEVVDSCASRLGISKLKKQQHEAIVSVLAGKDVFVSLPTGFGKSVIYNIIPICLKRLFPSLDPFVLIISPLISLMEDQISNLKDKGINAVLLHKDLDSSVILEHSHVFCSPECLLSSAKWRKAMILDKFGEQLAAICIDEAHCIVKW